MEGRIPYNAQLCFFHLSPSPNTNAMTVMKLDHLPEDCISLIQSFLSPRDACRSSLVSTAICSAANSDTVWESLLPPDYCKILSRTASPIKNCSKKELFFILCSPFLIDGGTKAFWVEKSTGKKCYALCARELSITWAGNPLYWAWKPHHRSRFTEVAVLRTTWWLEIQAKMKTKQLSPRTAYAAYLVVMFEDRAYGLNTLPAETSLQMGAYKSRATVHLHHKPGHIKQSPGHLFFTNEIGSQKLWRSVRHLREAEEESLFQREDGWIEIKLGEFYIGQSGGDEEEVKVSLTEVKGVHLKAGLTVESVEIRPKQ